jgi:hypothetical protein
MCVILTPRFRQKSYKNSDIFLDSWLHCLSILQRHTYNTGREDLTYAGIESILRDTKLKGLYNLHDKSAF